MLYLRTESPFIINPELNCLKLNHNIKSTKRSNFPFISARFGRIMTSEAGDTRVGCMTSMYFVLLGIYRRGRPTRREGRTPCCDMKLKYAEGSRLSVTFPTFFYLKHDDDLRGL